MKFFKKYDLIKIILIIMLAVILGSWFIQSTYFANGELQVISETSGIIGNIFDGYTIGLFDITTNIFSGFYYFVDTFVILLVIGAFYKLLGTTKAYNNIVDNVAKLFKGKEKVFVILSVIIYAVLASITTLSMALVAFIPFTIAVLSRMKVDKISAVLTTFGGIIVGQIGATYNNEIMSNLNSALSTTFGTELATRIVLGVIALILLIAFIYNRMDKKHSSDEVITDVFASKKVYGKGNVIPMAIVLVLTSVLFILGYTSWTNMGVTAFTEGFTHFQERELFGNTWGYTLIGASIYSYGEWNLYIGATVLILAGALIKVIYSIPMSQVIDSVLSGVKKMVKPLFVVLLILGILIMSVQFPTIPTIVNWINSTIGGVEFLQPFTWILNVFIAKIFAVDITYVTAFLGNLYSTFGNTNAALVSLVAGNGVAGLIAPTSLILALGLSLYNIDYKDYVKASWKYIVGMIVVALVITYITMFV